ncbi:MAG: hypothetical protein CMG47_02965 [Candidatus Marinimicrobia bacterium]|nr:hypothetical protein [Candidatus Neomarinimicrobiota bacterium]
MNNKINEEKLNKLLNLYQNHDYDNLISNIKTELKDFDHPILYNLLGAALINKNDLMDAEDNYKTLTDKFPKYIDGFVNLGTVYQKMKRYDDAVNQYNSVLDMENITDENKQSIFHNLGTIFIEKADYIKAYEYLKKALLIDPNSFETLKNLGSCCRALMNFDECLDYYQKALDKISNDDLNKFHFSEICMEIAQVYRSIGDYSKADYYIKHGPGIIENSDYKENNSIGFHKKEIHPESKNTFIGCWDIDDLKLMDDIVNFFEENPKMQSTGRVYGKINQEHKKSIDMSILPYHLSDERFQIFSNYAETLNNIYNNYKKDFHLLPKIKVYVGNLNIQKYGTGGHFRNIHTERTGSDCMHRMFAWMTYLNDVDDGGKTYFPHFDINFVPKKGRTLIWPSDWTHAHYAEEVQSGNKYIINGWFELIQ